MEKRAILAAVLMVALLLIYQAYFLPGRPPAPAPTEPEQQASRGEPAPATPAPGAGAVTSAPPVAPPPKPAVPAAGPSGQSVRAETPLYHVSVNSVGGRFQDWTIKYRGEKPWISGPVDSRGLVLVAPGAAQGQSPVMQFVDRTVGGGADRDLKLAGRADDLQISENIAFSDGYSVDIGVRIQNTSAEPRTVTVSIPWDAPQSWKDVKEKFPGQHPKEVVWASNGHVQRAANLCEVPAVSTEGQWIALGSGGYMIALTPVSGGFTLGASAEDKKVCDSASKEPVGRVTIALQAAPTIQPGQMWEGRATVFVGPKEYDRLRALGLDGAINWGCFPIWCQWGGLPMEWLGVPILKLMNWLYGFVRNYGVAIILLTVISKALFYPLTVRSMRSMRAMQALQPQVNALRNKHRSDPRKLQEETMTLYRKHGVNPMGGCLPMVAQIPIFYALYAVLSVSAELQSAPFLCFGRVFGVDVWICDLANVDPLYILPVLMAVTMFIQQKMTPTAADPQQAKMMLMMPLVFGGMFIVFPIASGLTLYWTVSNILQIGQQWLMNRGSTSGGERKPTKAAARA